MNPWNLIPLGLGGVVLGQLAFGGTKSKFDNVSNAQSEKLRLDADGNGRVDANDIRMLVAQADTNGDGKLDGNERNALHARTGVKMEKGGWFDKVTVGEATGALAQRANHINAMLGENYVQNNNGNYNFDQSNFGYQGQNYGLGNDAAFSQLSGFQNNSNSMPKWMKIAMAVSMLGPLMSLFSLFKK